MISCNVKKNHLINNETQSVLSWVCLGVKESLKCMIFEEFFSESIIRSGKMPEGGGQGGGGAGHAVLEGSYELHDTVGTGGFAKVISKLSKFECCLYARVSGPHGINELLVLPKFFSTVSL